MSVEPKSSTLTIRLTAAERETLAAAAAREGRTIGAHVKHRALESITGARVSEIKRLRGFDRMRAVADEFRRNGWTRSVEEIDREIAEDRGDR